MRTSDRPSRRRRPAKSTCCLQCRVFAAALQDPRMRVSPPAARGVFLSLIAVLPRNGGLVLQFGAYVPQDTAVAAMIGVPPSELEVAIAALAELGLIDRTPGGALRLANLAGLAAHRRRPPSKHGGADA